MIIINGGICLDSGALGDDVLLNLLHWLGLLVLGKLSDNSIEGLLSLSLSGVQKDLLFLAAILI
jgi:hypothetical protein